MAQSVWRALRAAGDLWAITSYFNPLSYKSRLANYRLFRERLGLPLVTVELAYGPEFELDEDDADTLVQLRGGDVLWQKERLLNIALDALPVTCTKVAWIDCDLIFLSDDWPERAQALLERYMVVQLFDRVNYLEPTAPLRPREPNGAQADFISIAAACNSGLDASATLSKANGHNGRRYMPGLAWAAQRELLSRHRFYDTCIIGGGDSAISCAFYGCFNHAIGRHGMNDRQTAHYLAWAERVHDEVGNAIGLVDGPLLHLWHGALEDRRWYDRYEPMREFRFDPLEDIALTDNRLWRWSSDKPGLHSSIREYFASRREDG